MDGSIVFFDDDEDVWEIRRFQRHDPVLPDSLDVDRFERVLNSPLKLVKDDVVCVHPSKTEVEI